MTNEAESQATELERWRKLGQTLWLWVRMWPQAGCDRETLEAVAELADLLGQGDDAIKFAGVDRVEQMLDQDACGRMADWFEQSGWIRRLEPGRRQELINAIRSGEWLGG